MNKFNIWLSSFAVFALLAPAIHAQDGADDVPTFEDAPVLLEKADVADFSNMAMRRVLDNKSSINMGDGYELLYQVSQRLARTSGRADINWNVVLIESDLLQAWSLPGGEIAIYTGLLKHLNDKQEVASLIAHQMAHVMLGHDLFVLNQNDVQSNILAQNISFAGNQWEELAVKTGSMLAQDIPVGSYSRMMESEADDLAGVLLIKAGFDPASQIGLWQFMKYENQLNPEYVLSHPSLDWRISQMQSSLPCYYQVYKEIWGQLPAGLGSISSGDNVQCPAIVTGVMGKIREKNEPDVVYVRDEEDYDNGYEDGYKEGRRKARYVYDWYDFPGYRSIYYDDPFYSSHFYYDPYFLSWNYGHHHYNSFQIVFGGYHYYRWSPTWYGWTYYRPYRPAYRWRDGNRRHQYRTHDRYKKKAVYKSSQRATRNGSYVSGDIARATPYKARMLDEMNGDSVNRQRVRANATATQPRSQINPQTTERPRRVKRDGNVASRSYKQRVLEGANGDITARDSIKPNVQRNPKRRENLNSPTVQAKRNVNERATNTYKQRQRSTTAEPRVKPSNTVGGVRPQVQSERPRVQSRQQSKANERVARKSRRDIEPSVNRPVRSSAKPNQQPRQYKAQPKTYSAPVAKTVVPKVSPPKTKKIPAYKQKKIGKRGQRDDD